MVDVVLDRVALAVELVSMRKKKKSGSPDGTFPREERRAGCQILQGTPRGEVAASGFVIFL